MIVHQTGMSADYDILIRYLRKNYPGCTISLIYEAGFSGFGLHDKLMADGIDCVVTPPHTVKVEKVNRIKTDKRDAYTLARNLENNEYKRCFVPDKERREDRQISRSLQQIERDIKRTKNRIRKFLDFHGLNEGFRAGAWTSSDYRRVQSLSLGRSLDISLKAMLRILSELESVRDQLKRELKALCEKNRYKHSVQLKQSCPGIGWLTAIQLTLEWGDMSRFSSGKKIAAFTGLTASEYSSGEKIRRGRITGQSSKHVRSWLIQCAWRAIRIDPVLLGKFRAVWKNTGSKKKAIVAVARKIAVRLRAIEVSQIPYAVAVLE